MLDPVTILIKQLPVFTITFDLANQIVQMQVHRENIFSIESATKKDITIQSSTAYDIRHGDLGYPYKPGYGTKRRYLTDVISYDPSDDSIRYGSDYAPGLGRLSYQLFSMSSGLFEYSFPNDRVLNVLIPSATTPDSKGMLFDIGTCFKDESEREYVQIRMSLKEVKNTCYWIDGWTGPTLISPKPLSIKDTLST